MGSLLPSIGSNVVRTKIATIRRSHPVAPRCGGRRRRVFLLATEHALHSDPYFYDRHVTCSRVAAHATGASVR